MTTDEERLQNRFTELAERAARAGVYTHTGFLSLGEQSILLRMQRALPCPVTLDGGAEDAERRIALFGSEALCGTPPVSPVRCVSIIPRSKKFSEPLAHRDCLGAILHLGLSRETVGDIALADGGAFVFCTEAAAALLAGALTQVRHTAVDCALCADPPVHAQAALVETTVRVASVRLDALVARAFSLSREESAALFRQGRVYLDGMACDAPALEPAPDSVVSVRGCGRLIYRGVEGTTKKGALRVRIDLPAPRASIRQKNDVF